jgi:hypothetical protein
MIKLTILFAIIFVLYALYLEFFVRIKIKNAFYDQKHRDEHENLVLTVEYTNSNTEHFVFKYGRWYHYPISTHVTDPGLIKKLSELDSSLKLAQLQNAVKNVWTLK